MRRYNWVPPPQTVEEGQFVRGQTIEWEELSEEFLLSRMDRGCKTKHIYDLRKSLEHAANWFASQGILPAGVNRRNAQEYLRAYRAQGVADISVKHRKVKLTSLFHWAFVEEFFPTHKLATLETPSVRKKTKHALVTDDEIALVIAEIKRKWNPDLTPSTRFKSPEGRRFFEVRDIAITLLLANSGMRIGECFGIQRKNINFQERTILLENTKNDTDRQAVFSEAYGEGALLEWLEIRNQIDSGNDYLFITELNTKLDSSSWGKSWNKYRENAGIERRIRRHDFRHYVSTKLDEVDSTASKNLLGHETDEAHALYNHRVIDGLRSAHDKAAPAAAVLEQLKAEKQAAADAEAQKAAEEVRLRHRAYTQNKTPKK